MADRIAAERPNGEGSDAEWLVEEGIGETRAILMQRGEIAAARIDRPGTLAAGQVADAVLVARTAGAKRGTVRFPSGEEALVDGLPQEASEGAPLRVIVTRAAIAESGRLKRAQGRPSQDAPRPAPTLAERLRMEGYMARTVHQFPDEGWYELFHEAWDGIVPVDGGRLTISLTPAMTVIDIDGALPARALALAAVPAIASAIRRFDLAGSIGIDFPTLPGKADRRCVDDALSAALADWNHERTSMNGFGFVHLVARLERPSLMHCIARDRAGAAARLLMRRAEHVSGPGAILLCAHPAVHGAMTPGWEAELARRTGKVIRWRDDPGLALNGGFAQAVPL